MEFALQLWYMVIENDIPSATESEANANVWDHILVDQRLTRALTRASQLKLIVARLCLFFDQFLMLERASMRIEVTPMFKNILIYTYQNHLILCFLIHSKLPQRLRLENKWAIFLGEVTKTRTQLISKPEEAKQLLQQNNLNTVAVVKNLIRHATKKTGFFETLALSLTYLNRLTLQATADVLQKHGVSEADKMKDIKPMLV